MSFVNGRLAEQRVISMFNKLGVPCKKSETELLEYDIELDVRGKKRTAEVKFDMMAEKTGNLAIEYWNSRKDTASGISATKANLWIICVLDDVNITIWATSVKVMKSFLDTNEPKRRISKGGDKNAELMLYDADLMLKTIFHRLDTIIDPAVMQSTIEKILRVKGVK